MAARGHGRTQSVSNNQRAQVGRRTCQERDVPGAEGYCAPVHARSSRMHTRSWPRSWEATSSGSWEGTRSAGSSERVGRGRDDSASRPAR